MHVILIGYRCAGKTTVGKIVASKMEMRFFDTDKLVEAKAKKSVARIFAEEGEGQFRQIESDVIEEICGGDGKVIAVGGGGPIRSRNVASLKRTGRIFYLKVSPDTVRSRLESDPSAASARPALMRDDILEEAREMMSRREPFYREAAEFTLDADKKSPEEIAEEIVETLRKHPERKEEPRGKGRRRPPGRGRSEKSDKKALDRIDPDSVGIFPREK